MSASPLISAQDLQARLSATPPGVRVLDCSFDLADASAGERSFEAGHIPGAAYLHLDRDLSGPKTGVGGRHPLPGRAAFASRIAALGVDDATALVVCDNSGGMYAARLWWMLRWAGHADVALLDGGLAAWRALGGALQAGPADAWPAGGFSLRPALQSTLDHAAVRQALGRGQRLVVDARSPDRFRGENETLDPVGGHIPGAVNRFFKDNLGADGRFKPVDQLRREWQAVLAGRPAADLVMQCGSGVTACHNLLALQAAGLGEALLYPGSWSDWSSHPDAPVAVGG